MKTTSLEPQVTTDRAKTHKTKQEKTEGITPVSRVSRKTDKLYPALQRRKQWMDTRQPSSIYSLASQRHLAQLDYVMSIGDRTVRQMLWKLLHQSIVSWTCQVVTWIPKKDQLLNHSAAKMKYCGPGTPPPQDHIKPSSYSLMQVSCTLCSDSILNNTDLGSLRHLSVFRF